MNTTARLASVGGLALAATALLASPATASPGHDHRSAHPVFVQTDNPNGNTIVAFDRRDDGTLEQAGVYETDGLGGVLTGSAVDHLASQGSLAYDRTHSVLYALNAGSNTVTVFAVHGDHLGRRQVISSGGKFPVSITTHDNLVYVLNARDGGSVQGYLLVGGRLVRVPSWHRGLGLDQTLTPEFTHTPGQIAFTPDGSKLVVTTKANGSNIDVFSVGHHGGPSAQPVVNADPGAVPFAVTFDSRNHLVVSEAGTNAVATYHVNPHGTLSLISRALTGQAATCWIVGTGNNFYASNAGSANLSGFRDDGSGALTATGTTSTDPGTVDAAASSNGHYVYAQTGAEGIVDEFRVNHDGSLTAIGSVPVPGGVGGEGIVAS